MLFGLKKTLAFFLEPLGLVLILSLIGFYALVKKKYNRAQIFLGLSLLFLLSFSYPPIANFLVKNLEDTYPTFSAKQHPNITYIHVLGFGHNQDTSQPISSRLDATTIKRISEGVLIYKQLSASNTWLIFSGGTSKENAISSGEMAANFAMALGVASTNIIIDTKAKDTEDEARFAQKITQNKPLVLVSSASHLPRAVQLFQSYGLKPIPAPTNFYKQPTRWLTPPSISALHISQTAIHEYLGCLYERLSTSIK